MSFRDRYLRHIRSKGSLVCRVTGWLYRRRKTYRDAHLANALLLHGGSIRRAIVEWLATELTGKPNRKVRGRGRIRQLLRPADPMPTYSTRDGLSDAERANLIRAGVLK